MNNHPILSKFTQTEQGYFKCQECSREFKCPLLDSLKKHYATYHTEIWETVKVTRKRITKQKEKRKENNVGKEQKDNEIQNEEIVKEGQAIEPIVTINEEGKILKITTKQDDMIRHILNKAMIKNQIEQIEMNGYIVYFKIEPNEEISVIGDYQRTEDLMDQ